MNIPLSPPPKEGSTPVEWNRWYQEIFISSNRVVRASGDANATIGENESYHGVTALSAARTKRLPLSSRVPDGWTCIVQDESGAAGTHTITIAVSSGSSDTLLGTATISSNYGRRTVVKRGTKFYSQ